jgi:hypothetical protein
MILGHAAGVLASVAAASATAVDVHKIDFAVLNRKLLDDGALLSSSEIPPAPGPAPGPAHAGKYVCTETTAHPRCIQLAQGGTFANASCSGTCSALGANEWLALKEFFKINGTNMTCTSAKPTFLKKSEMHSSKSTPVK